MLTIEQWLQIISIGTNIGVLMVVIRATRIWTEIEFKVNMMWKVFEHKFERRGDEFVSRPKSDRDY